MGDTGATFLGFILSVVSIGGTLKAYTAVAIAVPVLVLGLPIFDTVFAILRRAANGKPIMAADRGHLHHRLMDMGLSHRQSVVIMYTISAILGLAAISLVGNWVIRTAVVVVAGVVFTVAAVRYAVKTNVPDTADNIAGEGQSRPEDIPEEEVRKDEAETG
jgi:UDP-GlcNAc:undecaprenyl-phosphate GlcNAc-1-phosphate transferase